MDLTLRIAGIEEDSIVDGPGLRMTVFAQGCLRNCKGCHNPQTHALDKGTLVPAADLLAQFKDNPLLSGITFSGGEPFLQPGPLLWLAREVHSLGRTVMAFSGYTLEELLEKGLNTPYVSDLVNELDYLVDGPYVEELRNLELEYRGSSNQRYLKKDELADLVRLWKEKHCKA